jgi:hypothetical protein
MKDVQARNVKIYRYQCGHCHRTFRHYPATNSEADQTERLRLFAIGRMKMRARTVRGYKSWNGIQAGLLLAGSHAG